MKNVQSLESYKGESFVQAVEIENQSSMDYVLQNQSEFSLLSHADLITIKAHKTTMIAVMILKELPDFELHFKVLNAVVAPATHPDITLKIHGDDNENVHIEDDKNPNSP